VTALPKNSPGAHTISRVDVLTCLLTLRMTVRPEELNSSKF